MAKHFRPYDFNLAANGSQVVYAVGKYLKLLSATGGISVRVDGGSSLPMTVGQGLELEDGETWSEITITDTSGLANAGKLFIGAGRFTDQSLAISNEVSIADRFQRFADTGQAFCRVLAYQPGTAPANVYNVAFYNRPDSNKTAFINALTLDCQSRSANYRVALYNGVVSDPGGSQAASVAIDTSPLSALRYTANTTLLTTSFGAGCAIKAWLHGGLGLLAAVPGRVVSPIYRIKPGQALVMELNGTSVAADTHLAGIEWVEA
jgi:hypothetical protein